MADINVNHENMAICVNCNFPIAKHTPYVQITDKRQYPDEGRKHAFCFHCVKNMYLLTTSTPSDLDI